MCLRESWKRETDVRWQLITFSLASCLAKEPLMPFYHASTRETPSKEEEAVLCFVDLEKALDTKRGGEMGFEKAGCG